MRNWLERNPIGAAVGGFLVLLFVISLILNPGDPGEGSRQTGRAFAWAIPPLLLLGAYVARQKGRTRLALAAVAVAVALFALLVVNNVG